MAEAATKVAVLVLNWRQGSATVQVLQDLRDCGQVSYDVLVMDNGSGDDSVMQIEQALAGEEMLCFEENLGYCAAMNRGIDWAEERGAELVLFLNNDMRLPSDCLGPLVETMAHDPSLACVGPTILDRNNKVWSQGGRVGFHSNLLWLCGHGSVPGSRDRGPFAVDFMPGACALYRLADLKSVGGLDAEYFMYLEDVDLGLRLKGIGKKILWLPWVEVTHDAGLSSGGGRTPLRKYMMALNSSRFLRRHGTIELWAAFLFFDCLLWPLSLAGGELRASCAKGRGILAGLLGRKLDAGVVDRYVPRSRP